MILELRDFIGATALVFLAAILIVALVGFVVGLLSLSIFSRFGNASRAPTHQEYFKLYGKQNPKKVNPAQ